MIYINKGESNELVLNINNNSRTDFSGYTLTFLHILSQEVKSYTILTNGPYFGENIRYCEIVLDLTNNDLNYEGQYQLQIFGNGTSLVYTGMVFVNGTTEIGNTFIEYISDDEDNSNFIYVEEQVPESPTPTPTNTVTPTITPTPTLTPGLSPSPTPTTTTTPTPSVTSGYTITPTPTTSVTPTLTPGLSPSPTPTPSSTPGIVTGTTLQFRYTMNLGSYGNGNLNVTDFKWAIYPLEIVCPQEIVGTEPYTFTSNELPINFLVGTVDASYVYRSVCRPSGNIYSIQKRTCNIYRNGILVQTNSSSESETPNLCTYETSTRYLSMFGFTISQNDKIIVEWLDIEPVS